MRALQVTRGPARVTLLLALSRHDDARANLCRGFAGAVSCDLAKLHRRHLDVQINAVEQRPGKPNRKLLERIEGFIREL